MTEINIPFNDWSKKKLRAEKKNATTRTEKYGEVGDFFSVDLDEESRKSIIKFYKLWGVLKIPLRMVSNIFYMVEGCESPKEFREVWEDIHPRRGYVPDWKVYIHFFEETKEEVGWKEVV